MTAAQCGCLGCEQCLGTVLSSGLVPVTLILLDAGMWTTQAKGCGKHVAATKISDAAAAAREAAHRLRKTSNRRPHQPCLRKGRSQMMVQTLRAPPLSPDLQTRTGLSLHTAFPRRRLQQSCDCTVCMLQLSAVAHQRSFVVCALKVQYAQCLVHAPGAAEQHPKVTACGM